MTDSGTPERWLPIPGYEGAYDASDWGRIWSWLTSQALKTPPNGDGYPLVVLCDHGNRRSWSVHTLVALTFLGPRPEGMEVRHLDGVKTNCHLDNLAYGTGVDNEADKRRHGTHEKASRVVCPLGHRLITPNLVLGAPRSRSSQLHGLCARAQQRQGRHPARHDARPQDRG